MLLAVSAECLPTRVCERGGSDRQDDDTNERVRIAAGR